MLNGPSVLHQSQLDELLTVADVGLGKALADGSSPGLSILSLRQPMLASPGALETIFMNAR